MAITSKIQPLAHELASLLVSDSVQSIRFRFGDIQILPEDFRHIAFWLRKDNPFITVIVDPKDLGGDNASYEAGANTFRFKTDTVMRAPSGRGTAVHESVHAITDSKKRGTMKLSEEAAAFIARAWYHIETGTEDDYPYDHRLLEIAGRIRSEAGRSSMLPEVPFRDRIVARNIMRKSYKPGLNLNKDGFP